jgi:hypothetical protein
VVLRIESRVVQKQGITGHKRGGVCIKEQAEPGCAEPIRHAQLMSVLGVPRAPIMNSQPQLGHMG